MKLLMIAEHDNKNLKNANEAVLTAAHQLSEQIDCLVLGYQCQTVVTEARQKRGIETVWYADDAVYAHQLAENSADLIAGLAQGYDYILAPASTFGKNLLPRVAAKLDVGMVADVIQVIDANTFVRPIYAGNALATVKSHDALKILTIRPTAFPSVSQQSVNEAAIQKIEKIIPDTLSSFIKQDLTVSLRPELTSAKIIISGGRGLKSAENFKRLEKIADLLGAALGASRAAVDAGFAPNDYQVGQTGKIVAPDLYIAVGISGAIQHLAGMKDSKVIVAINQDSEAPIFQIADYGLVGDLFEALQELEKELEAAAV